MNIEPFNFYLQDRGSSKGTYERISYYVPSYLHADQQILLGSHIILHIIEVKNTFERDTITQYSDNTLFNNTLRRLMKEGVEIIGTGNEHLNYLQTTIHEEDILDPALNNITWDSFFDFEVPYLKIEMYNNRTPSKATMIKKCLIFPHTQDLFTFGRCYDVDFPLLSSTCSLKHARILWECINDERCWTIYDGTPEKGTSNGTWINLRSLTEIKYEMSSRPVVVQNKSVFRFGDISATFLIDKINFEPKDLSYFRNTITSMKCNNEC